MLLFCGVFIPSWSWFDRSALSEAQLHQGTNLGAGIRFWPQKGSGTFLQWKRSCCMKTVRSEVKKHEEMT